MRDGFLLWNFPFFNFSKTGALHACNHWFGFVHLRVFNTFLRYLEHSLPLIYLFNEAHFLVSLKKRR